jgi:thymidylate kinase
LAVAVGRFSQWPTPAMSFKLHLKPHNFSGRLIVFSGTDGSGKSTLVDFAIKQSDDLGRRAVKVELLDEFIKQSHAFREFARDPLTALPRIDLLALSLMCTGNRLQNVKTVVLDELAAGSWIFCDRYIFTTWAEFLALSQDVSDREILRAVLELFPKPNLGFLAYASVAVCLDRVRKREEEKSKVLNSHRYENLILTYRRVGAENDLLEICSEQPQTQCEQAVRDYLITLNNTA